MKLETFYEKFDQFADAPGAVSKMRTAVRQSPSHLVERQRRSIVQPRVGATQERLPWDNRKKIINPNGVAADARRWTQPLQGWSICGRVPRVARASQPWAMGRNPVGIRETATAGNAE